MDIILLERIEKLGAMGDVVKVKDGFARNYLLPSGKALRANKANRVKFESERDALEAKNAERREAAGAESGDLDGQTFVVLRQAGESGQLYGSVSTRDIAEAASGTGVAVTRNQVMLDNPIKTIGLATVRIALHPEVSINVIVNVARTEDEAEAQARGEDFTGNITDREETRLAAEELFAAEEGEDGDEDDMFDEADEVVEDGENDENATPDASDEESK